MNRGPDRFDTPEGDDPPLLRAALEYLAELEAGRRPKRSEFLTRFLNVAGELGPYLDALDLYPTAARKTRRGDWEGEQAGEDAETPP
jgi:hypothetical protein